MQIHTISESKSGELGGLSLSSNGKYESHAQHQYFEQHHPTSPSGFETDMFKYMSWGTHGQPLVTPEPLQGTLLPSSEECWDLGGRLGSNVPLFASSFTLDTEIGEYASTCQAAHVLVLRHCDDQNNTVIDTHYRISEAQRLHQTIVLLNLHLAGQVSATANNSFVFTTISL